MTTPAEAPASAVPNDRRQANHDRRGNNRSGKFDRRRNRCGTCQYLSQNGFCQQHQQPFEAESFACVLYQAR
ncbi:MAG: hypothetical protein VKJ06_06405 [Vampirovibrionales bacterium]|nr:hypothetical protein [Vampirovibrionales bacterium]